MTPPKRRAPSISLRLDDLNLSVRRLAEEVVQAASRDESHQAIMLLVGQLKLTLGMIYKLEDTEDVG